MALQDFYINKLLTKGYKEVICSSRKYREFVLKNHPNHVFLGKSGAIRVGSSISKSHAMTESYKRSYFHG